MTGAYFKEEIKKFPSKKKENEFTIYPSSKEINFCSPYLNKLHIHLHLGGYNLFEVSAQDRIS
jgi:hypothetical protein